MSTPYLPTAGVADDPQFNGIYLGQVAVISDPLNVGRVRLFIPQVLGTAQSNWATPMQPGITPAAGTACLAVFLGGNINQPYYFLGIDATVISAIGGDTGVLNSNPFFTGNLLTGWTATSGTLTAIAPNADTNPPFPNAALWQAAGAAGGYIQESASEFSAVIAQPYMVTAWVSYPLGGVVNIGAAWTGQASQVTAVTVPAGAWTYISAVVNATATTGYPLVGPAASTAGEQFMVAAVTVTGQVPGQIIEQGTINTAQLNATAINGMTITGATMIADGATGQFLIYSGTPALGNLIGSWSGSAGADGLGNTYPAGLNVSVGNITGSTISGSTFMGTDFILNSSGLLIYSGAPALGNLIASVTPASGADGFGNAYPGGVSIGQGAWLSMGMGSPTPVPPNASAMWCNSTGRTINRNNDDGETYSVGQRVLVQGGQSITSTSGATLTNAQTLVSANAYYVRGCITWTQGSVAAQQNFWFNGPAATLVSVPYYFALAGSGVSNGVNVAMYIGSGGGASMPSPAFAIGATVCLYFEGVIEFSAAGTFGISASNQTSGDTCVVNNGSYMVVSPV